jgi:hypothetical protein
MRTDIAVGQRAEDGVDQRVEADVAVGMREKAFAVRHADAADHHVIAVAKGVNVVAVSGPDIAEHGAETRFLADKIFRCRQFHVRRIAFKCRHRQSRPFRKRRVVGEIAAAHRAPRGDGRRESHRTGTPAAFCATRSRARSGVASTFPLAVKQLDGIGDRYCGNGRAGAAAASIAREIKAAETNGRAASWIRTTLGLLAASASRPGMNRGLAGCAANRGRLVAQLADGIIEDAGVSRDSKPAAPAEDLRMAAKWLHRAEDHGPDRRSNDNASVPPSRREARGPAATRMAAVRSNFGMVSIAGDVGVKGGGWSAAHCPYHAGSRKQNDSR